MIEDPAADRRLRLAEALLQEAVYRSRGAQAGAGLIAGGEAAGCGLGPRAAVVLDLSAKGEQHFAELWPDGLPPERLAGLRDAMADWVRRQDALDRKRNHFLKDFRNANGFDRTAYAPEQEAAYRRGLDEVNAEVDRSRREAALAALALAEG